MTARCALSRVVSTPEVEDVLARAYDCGAWGAKVCGAGGGGCVAILGPPAGRSRLEDRLDAGGYRVLRCAVATSGLEIHEKEAAS